MILRGVISGLIVIAALALAGGLLGELLDRHWVDVYVRDTGVYGILLFLVTGALFTAIGLSRQLVAFLAGYGFGLLAGFLLSMTAVMAGCVLAFFTARLLLRDLLLRRYGTRLHGVQNFIRDNTFAMTMLLRLLPVGSNGLINAAAGSAGVHGLPFFLGSALGYIPQMLIFSLVGSGIRVGQYWQVGVAMAMCVLAALPAWHLYRRWHLERAAHLPGQART